MRNMAILAVLALLSGCAALAPDYLKAETAHVSHLSQHFGPDQTDYGYNQVGLLLGYSREVSGGNGATAYLEIGEAYAHPKLDNRNEVFNARAGFIIPLK